MPNSVQSRGSNRSNKLISKKSEVDESLFGNQSALNKQKQEKEKLEKIKNEVQKKGKTTSHEVEIIKTSDLKRIKEQTVMLTAQQQLDEKRILQEQKEKQLAQSKLKKEKMLQQEAEKKRNAPKEQTFEAKNQDSIMNRAAQIMDEQLDEVKSINKLVMQSKIVSIRDRQVLEKKQIRQEYIDNQKRQDLMMEIERLKKIKQAEVDESAKVVQRKEGCKVIVDQIYERELARLRQNEEQELEAQIMLKEIIALQQEDNLAQERKVIKQKQMQEEIQEANRKALLIKEKRKVQEQEEEEKIYKYNIEKAQKEAEYADELKRIADEKEKEIQRLRDLQEKASDRQAEMDALRAKRAVEANERQAREKLKKEAEIRQQRVSELITARQEQHDDKVRKLEEQARQDRDEFQRTLSVQQQQIEKEVKIAELKRQEMLVNAVEVKKQIALNKEQAQQQKLTKEAEGRKIKDADINYKNKVQNIKESKLNALRQQGVDEKYYSKLIN